MTFDVLVNKSIIVTQGDGLYTIILNNIVTGEVTKQENLTREQLEQHPMIDNLTLALLK